MRKPFHPALLTALALILCAGLLLTLEGVARRVCGSTAEDARQIFQDRTSRDQWSDFFRVESVGGRRSLVQALRGTEVFMPPQAFPVRKRTGTFRVVVLGESSANRLGIALKRLAAAARDPKRFEIMDCGIEGASLEQARHVFRQVKSDSPDLVVLVFGNNVWYYYPPPWRYRLHDLAARSRLVSLLAARLPADQTGPPQERFAERLHAFRAFLRELSDWSRRARVPVVLCTLPSNLLFPPFASDEDAAAPDFLRAVYAREVGKQASAARRLRGLMAKRDTALWHFELGEILYGERKYGGAYEQLRLARNLDRDNLRAADAVNDAIRAAAREGGVWLLDENELIAKASSHGIPGWGLFDDDCHLSRMNFLREAADLARLWAAHGLPALAPVRPIPPPFLRSRFDAFCEWVLGSELYFRWRWPSWRGFPVSGLLPDDQRQSTVWTEKFLEGQRVALAKYPDRKKRASVFLTRMSALLDETGQPKAAEALDLRAAALCPGCTPPRLARGVALLRDHRWAQARAAFAAALQLSPSSPEAAAFLKILNKHRRGPRQTR